MKEIKFFGRGGQGAVTAAQVLATAAFLEGQWAQTFPQFGAERRGAPVIAYVRLDSKPIHSRTKVYAPDLVVVMDFNLFQMLNPLGDLKKDGVALLNSPHQISALPADLLQAASRIYTVDATRIAQQVYGPTVIPITNVVILGAYCAAVKDVSLEAVLATLPQFFPAAKVEQNTKAAVMGFNNVRGE